MMKVTPHLSVGLLTAALLAPGCGDAPKGAPALLGQGAAQTVSALVNGADADAIFLQQDQRGKDSARTDAGSLNGPLDVAVGGGNVWIADSGNNRVLGFRNATSVTTGQDADIVLLQADMFSSDTTLVPEAQQLDGDALMAADTPVLVELDSAGRLYVSNGDRVVVYENPFGTDTLIDYELDPATLPTEVTGLRESLVGDRMMVVGNDTVNGSVSYYLLGQSTPIAQGDVAVTGCVATDAFETTDAVFVGCSNASVACNDVGVGIFCHGVKAFERDFNTGIPIRPAAVFDIYALQAPPLVPPTPPPLAEIGPVLFSEISNELVVLMPDQNRAIRFSAANTAATNRFSGGMVILTEQDAQATIYGQDDINSNVGNFNATDGNGIPSATGLLGPSNVALDADNNELWIADTGNNRVLRFDNPSGDPPPADRVLGQIDAARTIANRLEESSALSVDDVAIDPQTGRTYVVDTAGHRVLVFDNLDTAVGNEAPIAVLGQATPLDVIPNDVPPASIDPLAANRMSGPTHVAVDPTNGNLFVSDTGNFRILVFQNMRAATVPENASKVIGSDTLTDFSPDFAFQYRALSVRDNNLFVATGNPAHRVFYYDSSSASNFGCPAAVLGQNEIDMSTCPPDNTLNDVNRGSSTRPDGFNNVTDVSFDSQGRLWVADAGNNRVLGFAGATDLNSGSALARIEASIADIVVGQVDFTSNGAANSDVAFANPTSIAVDDAGILWVAQEGANRVLRFNRPTEPDPTAMLPRASLVLGQTDFFSFAANDGPNGISAGTMSGPNALALTDDGRTLVVADAGNNRVLRFLQNLPPVIDGGGTFTVDQGETISVPLTITDPEGDPTAAPALSGPVPMGLTLNGNVVSYDSTGAAVGTVVRATITVQDQGPRPQTATASVIIQVVVQRTSPTGNPPGQTERPIVAPDGSCKCSGGAGNPMLWLLGAFVFVLRRRRR